MFMELWEIPTASLNLILSAATMVFIHFEVIIFNRIIYLEHIKIKRFARILPFQLLVCICKTQLITRSETFNFIEPKTGEQV
jgi:hypothetical protein